MPKLTWEWWQGHLLKVMVLCIRARSPIWFFKLGFAWRRQSPNPIELNPLQQRECGREPKQWRSRLMPKWSARQNRNLLRRESAMLGPVAVTASAIINFDDICHWPSVSQPNVLEVGFPLCSFEPCDVITQVNPSCPQRPDQRTKVGIESLNDIHDQGVMWA